jgi:hypothetical protein
MVDGFIGAGDGSCGGALPAWVPEGEGRAPVAINGSFCGSGGDGCADEAGGCVPGDRPNAGMGSGNCLYEVLMSVRILEIREATHPISSEIANATSIFLR